MSRTLYGIIRLSRTSPVALPLAFALLTGCGDVSEATLDASSVGDAEPTERDAEPTEGDAAGAKPDGAPEPGFSLTPGTERLEARVTDQTSITVSLERTGDFSEAVVVSATNLPIGVSANDITIPAEENEGVLQIDASGAVPATLADVTLLGTSGSLTDTAGVELFVVGAAGTPDESFGDAGIAAINIGFEFSGNLVGLESGEMIVGGALGDGNLFAAKLGFDGELVPEFGDAGVAVIDLSGLDGRTASNGRVVRQSDGSLVVAGTLLEDSTVRQFVLSRLTPEGELDSTFAGGGIVAPTFDCCGSLRMTDVAVGPDDQIIIGANQRSGRAAIARFTESGEVDQDFGDAGLRSVSVGGRQARPQLAVQEDGKIVVAATRDIDVDDSVPLVTRLLADGADDLDFNGGDPVELAVFGSVTDAVIGDGRIVVAGRVRDPTFSALWARQISNGSPDVTFGEQGELLVPNPDGGSISLSTATIRGGGGVLAAGRSVIDRTAQLVVARTAEGAFDPSFGTSGISAPADSSFSPAGIALASPHRITVLALSRGEGQLVRFWD